MSTILTEFQSNNVGFYGDEEADRIAEEKYNFVQNCYFEIKSYYESACNSVDRDDETEYFNSDIKTAEEYIKKVEEMEK